MLTFLPLQQLDKTSSLGALARSRPSGGWAPRGTTGIGHTTASCQAGVVTQAAVVDAERDRSQGATPSHIARYAAALGWRIDLCAGTQTSAQEVVETAERIARDEVSR